MQVRNLPTIIFFYDRALGMSSWRGPQTSIIRLYDQVVNRFEVCSFWMVQVRNLPTNHFLQDLNVAHHSTMTVVYWGQYRSACVVEHSIHVVISTLNVKVRKGQQAYIAGAGRRACLSSA